MNIKKRRYRNILLLTIGSALTLWVSLSRDARHLDTRQCSGWLALGLIVLLAAFNLRKRLTFIPLLSARIWLQLHIYLGLFSGVVFLIHIRRSVPDGPFELTLALLFLIVFLSGIIGLVLTRILPQRIATQGQEVIFERIPVYRRRLRDEAEGIVLQSLTVSHSKMLAEFYRDELAAFFAAPAGVLYHLVLSQRPRNQLLAKIDNQKRYCSESERELIEKLRQAVITKDELDRSQCLQGVLKLWLFVHIPATYGLFALIILHIILVRAYMGVG